MINGSSGFLKDSASTGCISFNGCLIALLGQFACEDTQKVQSHSPITSLLRAADKRINYKLAVLTFKTLQTSSPQYLSQHISLRTSARTTRSSSVPLLCVPFRRTSFARRSFSTAEPLTWNSLPPAVLNCDSLSLSTFKSRLKTHLFSTAFC